MRASVQQTYRLAPMQEGMLFHSVSYPGSAAYISQVTCELGADLDREVFDLAWRRVIERHDILRTSFEWGAAHPMQHVHDDVPWALEECDWRDLDPAEQQCRLEGESQRDFDLGTAPLMRMRLCRTPSGYLFVWTHHHVLLDGRARVIVLNEVAQLYDAYRSGAHIELPMLPRYGDYVDWLLRQNRSGAEAFWRDLLGTFSTPASLVLRESTLRASGYGTHSIDVPPTLSATLRSAAHRLGVTVNILVQCAWAILMSRYTGQPDVVFGATRSCRRSAFPDAGSVVGVLMNTLPHRTIVRGDRLVSSIVQELRAQHVSLRDYQHTPLVDVRAWTRVPAGMSLFDSLVVFEERNLAETLGASGSSLWQRARRWVHTHYGLTLAGYAKPSLALEIDFARSQFDEESIAAMATHLLCLLEGIAANPDAACGALDMLTTRERRRVLEEWNVTSADANSGLTLPALVEQSVARDGNATAVVCEETRLSYDELNERSNRLAHLLIRHNMGPECRIALAMPRSIDTVVAMLAILKAAAVYVPFDIEYPPDRLRFMFEDARVAFVISTRGFMLPVGAGVPHVVLDEDSTIAALATCSPRNPTDADRVCALHPEHAAYVIYTSGSTGRPKGVVILHRAIVNKCSTLVDYLALTASTRFAATSSISFDPLLDQVFCPLAAGGTCVVVPDQVRDDARLFAQYAERHRISVLNGTPGLIERLLAEDAVRVDTLIVGADVFPARLAEDLRARGAASRILNFYGPTETCINAAGFEVAENMATATVPIGRALPNYRLYVLSDALAPVPPSVTGELYIAGEGTARGYLNQPALTGERFVADPFGTPGARMYRTGDRVRRRRDGNLEFLGRTDRQVKVRGVRVELGEIETLLMRHEQVAQAIVVTRDHAARGKEIVAYVVPRSTEPPVAIELRAFLARTLPPIMIPSAFVAMHRLPLTSNGKVDTSALPPPELDGPRSEPPQVMSGLEQLVAGIWENVLGVAHVGPEDDFFELGGHSLSAMQIVARVRDQLRVELPMRTLFDSPTPRGLVESIERQSPGSCRS